MQSDFIRMDIFFFISSVFSVIIGILVCMILWKILKLLGRVDKAREEIESFISRWKTRLKINKK